MFVLAKDRSEQLFTVPWGAEGTVGFWADRNVGTLFCPASPIPLSAVRRADRTRPLCVRVFDSTGHVLVELSRGIHDAMTSDCKCGCWFFAS